MSGAPLGAILAGGRSRRFGAPKALAEVGGRRIVSRVLEAMHEAVPEVVLIANEPLVYAALGLRTRSDALPGAGPLAGVHTALRWAEERGAPGALCVACDLPFLTPPLLQALVGRAARSPADAVAPEGAGSAPEPLCAVYSVRCLPTVEERLRRGERALRGLLAAVRTEVLPLAEVRRHGDPEVLFLNVNTPDEQGRAERIALERNETHAR